MSPGRRSAYSADWPARTDHLCGYRGRRLPSDLGGPPTRPLFAPESVIARGSVQGAAPDGVVDDGPTDVIGWSSALKRTNLHTPTWNQR